MSDSPIRYLGTSSRGQQGLKAKCQQSEFLDISSAQSSIFRIYVGHSKHRTACTQVTQPDKPLLLNDVMHNGDTGVRPHVAPTQAALLTWPSTTTDQMSTLYWFNATGSSRSAPFGRKTALYAPRCLLQPLRLGVYYKASNSYELVASINRNYADSRCH